MEVVTQTSIHLAGTLDVLRQAGELQSSLWTLLRPVMQSHEHPMPDLELSPRESRVLILLAEQDEKTMTDLAAATSSPLSTITRVVDRLAEKGLIERSRSEQDRRIVVVRRSERSKAIHESFRGHQLQQFADMLEPLSNGEREILLELLQKLISAAGKVRHRSQR